MNEINRPKISVIVPVYNVEPYIHQCIDSILGQKFTDFELLLIDDGSPDNCGVICDEYATQDPRVRVFHQDNAGVSAARNKGLDEASGEWIAFVDSDDWVDEYLLSELLSSANNNTDLVITNYTKIFNEYKDPISRFSVTGECDQNQINGLIKEFVGSRHIGLISSVATVWGCIFRANLVQYIRFKTLRITEDKLFILQVLCLCKSVFILDYYGYYYRNNISSSSRRYHNNLELDILISIEETEHILNKYQIYDSDTLCRISNLKFSFLYLFAINEFMSRKIDYGKLKSLRLSLINFRLNAVFDLIMSKPLKALIYLGMFRSVFYLFKFRQIISCKIKL